MCILREARELEQESVLFVFVGPEIGTVVHCVWDVVERVCEDVEKLVQVERRRSDGLSGVLYVDAFVRRQPGGNGEGV